MNRRIRFSGDLEDALSNQYKFVEVVTHFCKIRAADCGLAVSVDEAKLLEVHQNWQTGTKDWLASSISHPETVELNHFKSFAVLTDEFSCSDFVNFKIRDEADCKGDWFDVYREKQSVDPALTKSLLDGQNVFVGWVISHNCVAYCEEFRDGRETEFQIRITEAFEDEMVTTIAHGAHNPLTLYMVYLALFLRD
jgi:hypothetical protein